MDVDIETDANAGLLIAVIREPRLDAAAAPELKAHLGARIGSELRAVVLDVGAVDFVDSTGLGALLSLLKRMTPGGRLLLCGCQPPVVDVLRLTRLDRVFGLCSDTADARERLRP